MPADLDLARIAEVLRAADDALEPVEPLAVLEGGFGSVALETASGYVVLVSRDEARPARYAMAARLLPLIEDRLSLAVPCPAAFVEPSGALAHALLVYPRLPGRPLATGDVTAANRAETAATVARCLLEIHGIPIGDVAKAALPTHEPRFDEATGWIERAVPALQPLLTPDERRRVTAWATEFLEDSRLREYAPVLRHGDPWYGNWLADDHGRLTGLIDWEDAAIGDPAIDFSDQLYLGHAFTQQVIDAYRDGGGRFVAGDEQRMRRWWEVREFQGIDWSLQHGDEVELAESIEKLRRNPVLAGW